MSFEKKVWTLDDVVKPEDANRWEDAIEESFDHTRHQVDSTGDSTNITITVDVDIVPGVTVSFKPPVRMDSNTTMPYVSVNGETAPLVAADSDTVIVGSSRLILLPTRWYDIQYTGSAWVLQSVQSMTKIAEVSDAAVKLQSARQLTVDLAKTTVTTFDGSAAVNIPVAGILPVSRGGTGSGSGQTFEYDQYATSTMSGSTLRVTSRTPKVGTTYSVTFVAAAGGASVSALVIDNVTITAWRNALNEDVFSDRADLFAAGATITIVRSGTTAFFKSGGAASGLRIRVIGGTSRPAYPREGDIWVNTSYAISTWGFDVNTNAANAWPDGSILIFHGNSSSGAQIQAVRSSRRFIWLYPTGARQKRGGVWYDVNMEYFQDGQWRTPRVWLFNLGNTYQDYTGGFKFWYEYIAGGGGDPFGEYIGRIDGQRIQIQGVSNGSYWKSWVSPNNAIDVTGFRTMNIRYIWTGQWGDFTIYCGAASGFYDQIYLNRNAAGTISLNVSNVSGLVTPSMAMYMASRMDIYEWWFE